MTLAEVEQNLKGDPTPSCIINSKRKLGMVLTWVLINTVPSVSANAVTISMLPLNLVASGILYYAIVTQYHHYVLVSFVVYLLSTTLDCVDGNIARIKRQTSIIGVYLDRLVHNISNPVHCIVLGFALYQASGHIGYLVIFVVVGVFSELSPLDVSQKDVEALFIRQMISHRTKTYGFRSHSGVSVADRRVSSDTSAKGSQLRRRIGSIICIDAFYMTAIADILLFDSAFYFTIAAGLALVARRICGRSDIQGWEKELSSTLSRISQTPL